MKSAERRSMVVAWADMEEIGERLRAGWRAGWLLLRRLEGLAAAARALLEERGLPPRACWYGVDWGTGEWRELAVGDPGAGLIRTLLPPASFDVRSTELLGHAAEIANHLYLILINVERIAAAWDAGAHAEAEAEASALLAYVTRYGDQLANEDRWRGERSRLAAATGAVDRDRSEVDERHGRWRTEFAAQSAMGVAAWARRQAALEGCSPHTIEAVLKGKRGRRNTVRGTHPG